MSSVASPRRRPRGKDLLEALGECGRVLLEQVPIDGQGEAGRLMAEDHLKRLRRSACMDHRCGSRVTKHVHPDLRNVHRSHRWAPHLSPEVRVPQGVSLRRRVRRTGPRDLMRAGTDRSTAPGLLPTQQCLEASLEDIDDPTSTLYQLVARVQVRRINSGR